MRNIFICLFIVMLSFSCTKKYSLQSLTGTMVLMDSSFDTDKYKVADSVYNYYKSKTAYIMDSVIAYNEIFMDKGLCEESLLGNFAADMIFRAAEEIFNTTVDVGLINRGGLRTAMPQGEITLGNVYEVFPFENHVSIVELKGTDLQTLFNDFACTSVQCLSGVKLTIKNNTVESVLVGEKTIDNDRIYKIATIDYLAEGNDNIKAIRNAVNRIDSPVLLREAIAEMLIKDKVIKPAKDGRIVFLN